jgi:hypothetical protein
MYGSMIWLPRVRRYNISMMVLKKLQRISCLAICGAMNTTPRAAVEGLLHVIIEMELQAAIYRLMCNHQWKPKSTKYRDIKMSQDMEHQHINPPYVEGQIK